MAELACPNCGNELTFLEQYSRHYCHRCGQYAPEGYGERGAKPCPTCGGILSYVAAYDRFYCYRCSAYAPVDIAEAKPGVPAAPEAPSATMGETPATPAASASTAPEVPSPAATPATQIVSVTPEEERALVAAAAPPAAAAPASEGAPREAPKTEAKPAEAAPSTEPAAVFIPTTILEPVPEKPAEPEPTKPSPPMRALAASKPAIVRVKIFSLKKTELMDLCKAYDLDPSGTKEQLQERLLSYLHDLESEDQGEPEPAAPVAEEKVAADVEAPATAEPEPAKVEDAVPPEVAPASAAPAQVVLVEEAKPAPAASMPAFVTAAPAPVVIEVPKPAPHVEHPCPTCGRELTFIAQYGRWYCYFCQRYAPSAKAKNACPTCGATMRWIRQYRRWWCDACQKYASADLPGPSEIVAPKRALAAQVTAPRAASRPAIILHHHRSPAMGIGLIGFGLALFVIVEFFAVLAPLANLAIDNPFTGDLAAVTEFVAVVVIAAGAMLGLYSMRDRT